MLSQLKFSNIWYTCSMNKIIIHSISRFLIVLVVIFLSNTSSLASDDTAKYSVTGDFIISKIRDTKSSAGFNELLKDRETNSTVLQKEIPVSGYIMPDLAEFFVNEQNFDFNGEERGYLFDFKSKKLIQKIDEAFLSLEDSFKDTISSKLLNLNLDLSFLRSLPDLNSPSVTRLFFSSRKKAVSVSSISEPIQDDISIRAGIKKRITLERRDEDPDSLILRGRFLNKSANAKGRFTLNIKNLENVNLQEQVDKAKNAEKNRVGSKDTPLTISNCIEFQNLVSRIRQTLAPRVSVPIYVELTNDIDCSDTVNWNNGEGFQTIKIGRKLGLVDRFYFDGKGFKIMNLYMNSSSPGPIAIFDRLKNFPSSENSYIKNLNLENVNITGSSFSNISILSDFVEGYDFENIEISGQLNHTDEFSSSDISILCHQYVVPKLSKRPEIKNIDINLNIFTATSDSFFTEIDEDSNTIFKYYIQQFTGNLINLYLADTDKGNHTSQLKISDINMDLNIDSSNGNDFYSFLIGEYGVDKINKFISKKNFQELEISNVDINADIKRSALISETEYLELTKENNPIDFYIGTIPTEFSPIIENSNANVNMELIEN